MTSAHAFVSELVSESLANERQNDDLKSVENPPKSKRPREYLVTVI
jgi:hypothetical protein